ncbi:MAG: hypothetical protein IKB16_07985 [Lentisphaeria bacterium]|nr:hypothetical protein [Lentisphaeria bacterium]
MSWCTADWSALMLIAAGAIIALCLKNKTRLATFFALAALTGGVLTFGIYRIVTFRITQDLFFQIPILILALAGGFFSPGYLKGHGEERAGIYWCFFNLTVAAMLGVTICYDKIGFLFLWELMGLASMALVLFNYREERCVRATWSYLLACEAGGLFLILLFVNPFSNPALTFAVAILGFGLKIGFPLLHYWLPEAHPEAPAPVSALMSGAMIQLGYLGLLRWGIYIHIQSYIVGITLLTLGCIGALGGIIFALSKKNIKGMLAYSSIENMGILGMGFGLALLAKKANCYEASYAAFAGASLHALNHAFLKGGLFLGAGAIQKGTHGSLNMDIMGGLLKRMPFSGSIFLINAAGLSGLPPFCGFVSEFLIYYAAVNILIACSGNILIATLAVLIVLSLTGGFAAAAFTKTAGAIFLGEPRSDIAKNAEEVPFTMRLILLLLCLGSCAIVFISPLLLTKLLKGVNAIGELQFIKPLWYIAGASVAVVILFGLLAFWRFKGRKMGTRRSCTWDCGYAAPDARMEYTGTAFSQPLTDFFHPLLQTKKKVAEPAGEFPVSASYEEKTPDPGAVFYLRILRILNYIAEKIHHFQSGFLHLYILAAALALLFLLLWAMFLPWGGEIMGKTAIQEYFIFPWNPKGGSL